MSNVFDCSGLVFPGGPSPCDFLKPWQEIVPIWREVKGACISDLFIIDPGQIVNVSGMIDLSFDECLINSIIYSQQKPRVHWQIYPTVLRLKSLDVRFSFDFLKWIVSAGLVNPTDVSVNCACKFSLLFYTVVENSEKKQQWEEEQNARQQSILSGWTDQLEANLFEEE